MIDFSPTEEQLAYVNLAREFVARYIKPVAVERDQLADPWERLSLDIVEKAHESGLKSVGLSKKYGGANLDVVTMAMMCEELGAGDLGISTIIFQCWNISRLIERLGTEEQQQRFIPPFLKDPRFALALGMTEPQAGTDHLLPYDKPDGGPMLSAVPRGDEIILNGMKHFISQGASAKLYLVYARTDKSVGLTKGLTAFLVPSDAPGFKVSRIEPCFGQRLNPIAELIFEDCRIPGANQLTPLNDAWRTMRIAMRGINTLRAASLLGVGRTAYEASLEWAKTRVQGGKPIIEHQMVAMRLGEMYMSLDLARNAIWKSAWSADHPDHFDPRAMRVARLFAAEAAAKVAFEAVRLHGGIGTIQGLGIEKLFRDSLTGLHPHPRDVHNMSLGYLLGGLEKP